MCYFYLYVSQKKQLLSINIVSIGFALETGITILCRASIPNKKSKFSNINKINNLDLKELKKFFVDHLL